MRFLGLVLIAAAVGSCTTAPTANTTTLTPREQARLASLTAGRVAGQPMSCLPHYYTGHMTTIDGHAVAFRVGSKVYLNNMQGNCPQLRDRYTLVTRQYGSSGLCRGDIVRIVDLPTGGFIGSCVFGEFVPYAKPGARY